MYERLFLAKIFKIDGNKVKVIVKETNNPAVIQVLLYNGANVNDLNKFGDSALMLAVRLNKVNAVLVLLEAIPDITIKNDEGRTVWDLMVENKDLEDSEIILRLNNLSS